MKINGFVDRMYHITDWFVRLVYLNILFVVFTLLGLIVFGFYPSVIALFSVLRDWKNHKVQESPLKHYFQYYKSEFIKGNLIGLTITIISVVFYFDFQYLLVANNSFNDILFILFSILCLFFLAYLMVFFPVYVHFDMKLIHYFKQASIILLLNPGKVLIMFLSLFLLLVTLFFIPVSIFFFAISLFAYLLTNIAQNIFLKMEHLKKEVLN